MSKIIIHNKSKANNLTAVQLVESVMRAGFISGVNQYCWVSQFHDCVVYSEKTRGTTHTFKVVDGD